MTAKLDGHVPDAPLCCRVTVFPSSMALGEIFLAAIVVAVCDRSRWRDTSLWWRAWISIIVDQRKLHGCELDDDDSKLAVLQTDQIL